MIKFFCDRCNEEVPAGDVCQLTMDLKDNEVVKRRSFGICKKCRDLIYDVINNKANLIPNEEENWKR